MSPASKSKTKSKDKAAAKSAKEQQKASVKSYGSTNTVNGTPASAYNPLSGTFHSLEILSAAPSLPFNDNGRFRNIDDTDEHSSSPHGTVSEYDSVSNNGSCSGESEDHKEKAANSTRLETVPGLDNDRRDKIRLKNEKKHQRQRERRAQELHDRCSGYLMSRKLEGLSQQLVTMGFSHERATLALMLNGGKVEESVNWLFEGSEEETHGKDTKLGSGNLKIDITEELAHISAMEVKYKCSKQEVERAVVACEGDLVKAEETLHAQKPEPPATPQMPEEVGDLNNLRRPQEKAALASITMLQRRSPQDFNYTKTPITMPTNPEAGSRNMQQPANQPSPSADKRWTTPGPSPYPSSVPPSMQASLSSVKSEVRFGVPGNEGKGAQQVMRKPVLVLQRPQSINARQNPFSSISATPSVTTGWYSNSVPAVENMRSNSKLVPSHSTVNLGLSQSSEQLYHPTSYKESPHLFSAPVDSASGGLGGSWSTMGKSPQLEVPPEFHSSYNTEGASLPTLAPPSSLGLFTGWGSAGTLGTSSHVDWNTGGLVPEFDYTSIDWTLDSNKSSPQPNELWLGLPSLLRNSSGQRMGGTNGSCISGLRDNGVAKESSAGPREWTSPFAGKDIFSVPRQFVTSPSP